MKITRIVMACATLILLFCKPHAAAQETPNPNAIEEPALKVTLLFVPELDACKPDGYPLKDDAPTKRCQTLHIEEVLTWIENGRAYYQETEIPPEQILLTSNIMNALKEYNPDKAPNAESRWSMVLVFDWQAPQSLMLELVRMLQPGKTTIWRGELNGEQRWIHHEGAGFFHPSRQATWTLKTTDKEGIEKTISFRTRSAG